MVADSAEIGVFGGSGFYSLLEDVREIKVDTPYGPPSDSFFLASVEGRDVAFLPRHGRRHTIPPHKINYRANVWAMHSLGVKAVISPCAAGSLQLAVKPGDFVVCDQFVDRTNGRVQTFYDGPIVSHLSSAETYSPELRRIAVDVCRREMGDDRAVVEGVDPATGPVDERVADHEIAGLDRQLERPGGAR